MTCGRQLKRILSHFVGSPNSNPPLVVADRTIIDPDICVTSSRELVEACDFAFLSRTDMRAIQCSRHGVHLSMIKRGTIRQRVEMFQSTLAATLLGFRKSTLVFTMSQFAHSKLWTVSSARVGCGLITPRFRGLRHFEQTSFIKRSKDRVSLL
jgi:hypothetical protein